MYRIVMKSCLAVALTAALVVPAAVATADDPDGPVTVYVGDINSQTRVTLFKDETVVVTARLCSVGPDDLTAQLRSRRRVRCPGRTTGGQDAWVEDSSEQDGLLTTYVGDINSDVEVALLEDVSIPVAANLCGGAADTLAIRLRSDRRARCAAKTTGAQRAWVEYSRR